MTRRPNRTLPVLLGVTILGLHAAAASARSDGSQISDEAFVAWVRENAIRLDTPDWRRVDLDQLAALDEALAGKRIVYLGEADHYVREKYDFQLTLIRFLFERGWRVIGAEMGRSDGRRVDRYLETGDISWLDRVASYGYRGDFRSGRSDVPKGMVPAKRDRGFQDDVRNGQYWFQKQLRSLNESLKPGQPRLRWFGFDADLRAGGGYVDAQELLEPHRDQPVARELLQRVARVEGESRTEEIQRLEDVLASLKSKDAEVRACLGDHDAVELSRTIRALTAGFRFVEAGSAGPTSPGWRPALRAREQTMFRQMDEVLADLPADEKIILVGHMMHLSKDSSVLRFGAMGEPYDDPIWPTIGDYLAKKLPDEVYSIWMLYDHGRHGVPMLEKPIQEIATSPDRIEHYLAQAGALFLLPLHTGDPREAYLGRRHNFLNNGQYGNTILTRQADALYFVAEVNGPGGRETDAS